jgi:hypothetical protein
VAGSGQDGMEGGKDRKPKPAVDPDFGFHRFQSFFPAVPDDLDIRVAQVILFA